MKILIKYTFDNNNPNSFLFSLVFITLNFLIQFINTKIIAKTSQGVLGFSGRVCNISGSGWVGFVIFFSGSGRVRVSKKPSGRVGFSGFRVPDPSLVCSYYAVNRSFPI